MHLSGTFPYSLPLSDSIYHRMDSVTHIVLGACMGEAIAGKKLGKKAMLWGAAAQSIPDLDIIASTWSTTAEDLLAHRGFTHSLLFIVLVTPFLALLAERWHRPHNVSFKTWCWLFASQLLTHITLDGFNAYGTGWLEPFSHYRFSLNALFVADPFFTLPILFACIVLLFLKRSSHKRKIYTRFAIGWAAFYLCYCLFNKFNIERTVRRDMEAQQIPHKQYMTTPTPLNDWLWYIVAGDEKGFYVGYRSVFDKTPHTDFRFFPRNDSLLGNIRDQQSLLYIKRFSKGFYTVAPTQSGLVFNDLRFGQIAGWKDPAAGFVFYYYLDNPKANELIIQRGRFKGLNKEVWISLWERIAGVN